MSKIDYPLTRIFRMLEMKRGGPLPAGGQTEIFFADCWFLIWGMPKGNSPMDRLMTKQSPTCVSLTTKGGHFRST